MIRRDFLKRLTMTAAGVLVANDALALLTEPRRKYWAGADFGDDSRALHVVWRKIHRDTMRGFNYESPEWTVAPIWHHRPCSSGG